MIRKIVFVKLKDRWMAVLAVLLLIVLLIPLLRLAIYACPWYDDYLFLNNTRIYLQEEGGIAGFFHGVWVTVETWWHTWQGSFASIFFMAVNPFIFGEEYYFTGIIAVLLFSTAAAFYLVFTLCKYVMKADVYNCCISAVVVTATLIELIYTAQEGIYYYNAAVHYTLMHSFMFFMLAWGVKILYDEGRSIVWHIVLTSLMGILCGGSNYVTSLQGICFLASLFGLGILAKNKKAYWLLVPMLCYGAAFGINVAAPGNSVRASYFQGCGVLESIGKSFLEAANSFWLLSGPMFLVCLLVFIPVSWNMARKVKFSFRYPGLVSLYSFCLYATGFTSSFYSMGVKAGTSRTWVPIKFTFQLLVFANVCYWIGWLIRKSKKEVPAVKHYLWYYLMAGILALVIFHFTGNQAGSYSSYGAYYYVHTGEANAFRQQYLGRVEEIRQGGEVIELEPLVWRPWFLCKGDLSEDAEAHENVSMAMWYDKSRIYVKVKED